MTRKTIPINYGWRFLPDFQDKYLESDHAMQGAKTIMLPHQMVMMPANYTDERSFQFTGSYFYVFDAPELEDESRLFIRFHGVMNVAHVYLNGKSIGIHKGGYTPFKYDITDFLDFSGKNHLLVKVDGHEIENIPPYGGVVDYLGYAGIYREVELEIVSSYHLEHVFVKTDVAPSLKDEDMILRIKIILSDIPGADKEITFTLKDANEVIFRMVEPLIGEKALEFSYFQENIIRWDIDHPKLYTLETTLIDKGVVIDKLMTRFGFRTARFTPEGFMLNNRLLKLLGLNRHQSYPYVGYAMPKRMQEKDAEILKYELGCNIVRTSHYMQSDHFIRRADEIGLLVFEEIPGWQYIGNDEFKRLSMENLETMITHHFNHPAIILWGVRINESQDDHDFYKEMNMLAHALDDTRQTGGVRNIPGSELLEDVYTYNDFSHSGDNPGLERPNKITKALVPYLVTEHNGHMFPTKKNDSEERRIEHARRHLNVIDTMYSSERYSGAIGWCFADYATHMQFGHNDRICYHGVTDMFRIPKYASYPYMSQRNDEPILKVAGTMTPGAFTKSVLPETFIYTNCDYILFYLNDRLIGKYYPDWPTYGFILHAPIVIDDYIGDRILESGEFKPRVANKIKQLLNAFNRYAFKLPLKYKLKMLSLMFFNKFTMGDATRIYGKYIGNWGSFQTSYRFEGYMNDQLVKTVKIGQPEKHIFKVYPDTLELQHGDTYDVCRIVFQMEDENGNLLELASNVVNVVTDSHLEVIGPSEIALIGGSAATYLKTTGETGIARVKIRSSSGQKETIAITIK